MELLSGLCICQLIFFGVIVLLVTFFSTHSFCSFGFISEFALSVFVVFISVGSGHLLSSILVVVLLGPFSLFVLSGILGSSVSVGLISWG